MCCAPHLVAQRRGAVSGATARGLQSVFVVIEMGAAVDLPERRRSADLVRHDEQRFVRGAVLRGDQPQFDEIAVERLGAGGEEEQDEAKRQPLKPCFIELARVAWLWPGLREDNRPWRIGRAPPKFPFDEIGQTTQ